MSTTNSCVRALIGVKNQIIRYITERKINQIIGQIEIHNMLLTLVTESLSWRISSGEYFDNIDWMEESVIDGWVSGWFIIRSLELKESS